jgi:hypothetical protein
MPFQIVPDFPGPDVCKGSVCTFCAAGRRTQYPGGRHERVIATDLQLDDHDNVYTWAHMCETCAVELGHLVGMKTAEEVDVLRDERDAALARIAELEQDITLADEVRRLHDRLSPTAAAGAAPQYDYQPVTVPDETFVADPEPPVRPRGKGRKAAE